MEYFDLFSGPPPVEQDKPGPFAKLFLDAPQSSEEGGKSAQGLFSRLGNAAQSYLKWNMMGSPGATPGEMLKGMADWASLPMREPVHVPPDSHTDDSGRILVKRDGQLVPWQEADPVASRAYEEDMRARSQWGPQAALSMMGGTPFAGRGAAGAAGSRPLQAMAEPVVDAAQPGIRAYHGSPHDFNQFDLSKVGAGEGAQAYGHGLYFAENEATAKTYRDALSKGPTPDWNTPAGTAARYLHESYGEPATAMGFLMQDLSRVPEAQKTVYQEALGLIKSGAATKPPGHMYEVNIKASPEQFYDWDKTLNQQSPVVQSALKKLDLFDEEKIAKAADVPAVAERLRELGVAGFKYLDRGSRSAGAGTSNYVAFDPALIDILKKYGLTGLIAGPAASGVGAQLDGILQKANERANGTF